MHKPFWLFVIFLNVFINASGQSSDSVTQNRPWYLYMGVDLKYKSLNGSYNYYYQGEYDKSGAYEYVTNIRKEPDLLKTSRFYSPSVKVMVSRNRDFRFGWDFNLGVIEKTIYDTVWQYYDYEYYTYLSISALAEYNYYLLRDKSLGPFVFGSIEGGYYRGSRTLEGPGRELFGQLRGGGGYEIPSDWIFRVFLSQDFVNYREKSVSPIFDKPQQVKIDLSLFYWGFGIIKEFTLIPD